MKEKKNSFYCFARQRRPQQANALKTVPSIGKNCGEFYRKKRQTDFQIGIRIGTNMHSSFFGGSLVVEAGSWHDRGGGLLGYCLE